MADKCSETKHDGTPCKAWAIAATGKCAGHSKLGLAANPSASADKANAVRRAKGERRRMTAIDVLHEKLEQQADVLINAALQAASEGDWRATAWLYDRTYGRPTERVESTSSDADIRTMTSEQRATLRKAALAAHPELAELIPRNEAGLSDSKQASSLPGE